jgi:hypothetical protein
MKLLTALLIAISLSVAIPSQARNRTLMLTRDGAFHDVKVKQISRNRITIVNNRQKARGKMKIPTRFIYAILDKDGSNVFFDEDGNQRIVPAGRNEMEGTILFLKNHQFFPIYDLRIEDEGLFYRLSANRRDQYYRMEREKVFMVKHEDKHVTLFTNKYGHARSAVLAPPIENIDRGTPSYVSDTDFHPAPEMDTKSLVDSVYKINPYTLYKPGILLEYNFQKDGYLDNIHRVSYIKTQVADLRAKDGMLVPYVMQMIYNGEHRKVSNIPDDYYEFMFPVQIDAKGYYHLTHNMMQDLMQVDYHKGFGVLIPGDLKAGMRLPCGTLTSVGKTFSGKSITLESTYKEWHVVGETGMKTPAGYFTCMKLRGLVYERTNGKSPTIYKVACYLAKGIGIICYDSMILDGRDTKPLTLCLTRMQDNSKEEIIITK